MPTYRYFLNSSGNSYRQTWSDPVGYVWSSNYVPSKPTTTVPNGYYEVDQPYEEYQGVLQKTRSVDNYEIENNNQGNRANKIEIYKTVEGSFSGYTDYDHFSFDIDKPQKIYINFAFMPSSGLGTASETYAAVALYHDTNGDGEIDTETESYLLKAVNTHDSQYINLGDIGEYTLQLFPWVNYSDSEYRFIIESDAPQTYTASENGLEITHSGNSDVTVNADVEIKAIDNENAATAVAIHVANEGFGSATVNSLKGIISDWNGVYINNKYCAKNIFVNVHDVEALNVAVYVSNGGTGINDITINGQITVTRISAEFERSIGVFALGADTKITVAAGANIISNYIGIISPPFVDTNDTITVNGSVTGLYKAIWLVAGDDTVNLGPEARISGIIDGGSGSDIANFSANQTSLYNFTYNETTKASVVQIDGKAITFKDFELFKFLDDTSAMNASEMASTFYKPHCRSSCFITRWLRSFWFRCCYA